MKQITIGQKAWRNRVNDTTVHEYPAGWSGEVSNEVAERAVAANALDGKPRDVVEAKPAKVASAKKPPAKKPAVKNPAPTPAPASVPAETPAQPETEA